tara:strand:+ start:735 stop:1235 length:501 start_codon:yes stop_codon:yes gene_type:complete
MPELSYPEVFEKVGKTKSINEKKAILKEHENRKYFKELLIYMFDPRIKFTYTKSTLPVYVPDDAPEGMNMSSIVNVLPRMGYFTDYSPMASNPTKMNNLAISVLESISSKESDLLALIMTNSKYPYNGLTEKLVRDTFPDLLGKVEKKTTTKKEERDEQETEESAV